MVMGTFIGSTGRAFSFAHLLVTAFCVFVTSIFLAPAALAGTVLAQSPGCQAVNNGGLNLVIPGLAKTTAPIKNSNGFLAANVTADFNIGDRLIITYDVIDHAIASDDTASVTFLNDEDIAGQSIIQRQANYTIPATGNRSITTQFSVAGYDFPGNGLSAVCEPIETGSITIISQTDGPDGSFAYSGALATFTNDTQNGSASAVFSDLAAGSYLFIQEPNQDFGLTSISCSGQSSVIDLSAQSAAVFLTPGENIICTFFNVDLFDEERFGKDSTDAIEGFTYRRARAMLNAEPDRTLFQRRNPESLWQDSAPGAPKLSGTIIDSNGSLSFTASTGRKDSNLFHKGLELWVEANYTSAKDDFTLGSIDSEFGIVYVGADIQPSENLMVGLLASFDWAKESIKGGEMPSLAAPMAFGKRQQGNALQDYFSENIIDQKISGNGWMAGPYIAARLSENLFLSARMAAGGSDNELTLDNRVMDDPFETDRFLARTALTGNHNFGDFRFTPTASVTWFKETSKAYISKTGVSIPKTELKLGRAELKPEIAWRHDLSDGAWWESQFAVSAIWDFERPEILEIQGLTLPTEEFRGRAEGGVQFNWKNGNSLRLSASYDGIGADGYEAYGAGIWFDMPLSRAKPARKIKPAPAIPPPAYKYCPDGLRILEVDPCPEEKPILPAPEDTKLVIYFDHDKSNLLPAELVKIDEAIAAMKERDVKIVLLSGHTDLSGSDAYNEGLSMRRALVVRDALTARGVMIDKITYEFFGESRPAVPTKDGVRLQANRRTEVVIKFK
jgi:outer membrane protein OmpA-like peptidoglycan-associated protein